MDSIIINFFTILQKSHCDLCFLTWLTLGGFVKNLGASFDVSNLVHL